MATLSDCPDDAVIAALLGGELSEGERADALRHAADCGDCRELISELATTPLAQPRDAGVKKSFDRYELLEAVGAGGMGVVYEAHDRELDRRVALKLLREETSTSARRRSLLVEARAMAKLAHPNVVRVFDVGEHEGRVFVTMELVEGGTLRGFLDGTPRSFQEVARVFLDAGRGLGAAHDAGLVHRDFKPENVLLRSGTALVTDFGLAREVDAAPATGSGAASDLPSGLHSTVSTRASAVAGTLHYMAPEQLRGEKVDARGDLFSYCVAFWEAIYGERPFSGATPAELLDAMVAGPRPPRAGADVPRSTKAALKRGLAFAAADRHASMEAFFAEAKLASRESASRRLGPAVLVVVAMVVAVIGVRMTSTSRETAAPATSIATLAAEPSLTSTSAPRNAGTLSSTTAQSAPSASVDLGGTRNARRSVTARPIEASAVTAAPSASTPRGAGGIFVKSPY